MVVSVGVLGCLDQWRCAVSRFTPAQRVEIMAEAHGNLADAQEHVQSLHPRPTRANYAEAART